MGTACHLQVLILCEYTNDPHDEHSDPHVYRYHNVGSLFVPCDAPAGKKTMCKLFRYVNLLL